MKMKVHRLRSRTTTTTMMAHTAPAHNRPQTTRKATLFQQRTQGQQSKNNNNTSVVVGFVDQGVARSAVSAALSLCLCALVGCGAMASPALAAKPAAPVERKKGKVKIVGGAKVKNFSQESVVSVPSVPSLPGSEYKKGGSQTDSPKPEKRQRSSSAGASFSLPSFSLPNFNAPSVTIEVPGVSLEGSADGKTQAIAVLGAEIVAAGLATATVGSLTKQ